jgi:predicted 3-demethylubiquinone-9 3-methyltransferase (glyoxalase superfamily)
MQKIVPHLWFDKQAEEAVKFYTSIFKKGKIGNTSRYTEAGFEVHGMPAGTVLTVEFSIEGTDFIALNGGPLFKFNPSISFMVHCPSIAEAEELWGKLSEGGEALMPFEKYSFSEKYGWIKDKYGVTWQIMYIEGNPRKIYPVLLYVGDVAGKAEEAVKHYVSVFKDSKIGNLVPYPAGIPSEKEGSIMYGDFYLEGQRFGAMDSANPGHEFKFNEAISLLILCKDQKEIDYYWDKLNRDPKEGQCGWFHDKWGVSWQVTSEDWSEMFNGSDPEASDRAMNAMLKMKKIDIAAIRRAYEGK